MLTALLRGWRWIGSAAVAALVVAGGVALVAALTDVPEPEPREVIVIRNQPDDPSISPGQTISPSREPDDPGGSEGGDDVDDVTAQPDDIGDDDDDDGRDEDDDDDDGDDGDDDGDD